jgi:hypothetical protein
MLGFEVFDETGILGCGGRIWTYGLQVMNPYPLKKLFL